MPYSIVVVGATSVPATTISRYLTFIAGSNMTITPDALNKTITFASIGGGGGGATWYFGTAITGTNTNSDCIYNWNHIGSNRRFLCK